MAVLQWDTGFGDGYVTGGGGLWSPSAQLWTATNGASNTVFTSGDAAIFGGFGGTVTLSAAYTVSAITFGADNYTLTGGGLVIGPSGASFGVSSYGQTATINSVISGSGLLALTGGGTIAFGQSSAVALSVGGSATTILGAGWTGAISNSGTLQSSVSLGAVLTNSGLAQLSGTAVGLSNLSGGTLNILAGGLSIQSLTDVTNNGTLGANGAATLTLDGDLTGFGTLGNSGGGYSTIGQITVNSGTTLSGVNFQNNAFGYVTNNGAISANITNAAGGSLSTYGTGSITGTVTNYGATTFYGDLFGDLVNSGTATFALGAEISGDVVNSGTLNAYFGGMSIGGTLTVTGGLLNLQDLVTVTGAVTINAGTAQADGATLTSETSITLASDFGQTGEGYILSAPELILLDGANLAGTSTINAAVVTLGDGLTAATAVIDDAILATPTSMTIHIGDTWADQLTVAGSFGDGLGAIALWVDAAASTPAPYTLIEAAGGLTIDQSQISIASGAANGWWTGISDADTALTFAVFDQLGQLDLSDLAAAGTVTLTSGGDAILDGFGLSATQGGLAHLVTEVIGTGFADILDASQLRSGTTLSGGGGDDVLKSGQGADILTGGTGVDRFEFRIGFGSDRITDFETGSDQIDLTSLLLISNGYIFQLGDQTRTKTFCWSEDAIGSEALLITATEAGTDTQIVIQLNTATGPKILGTILIEDVLPAVLDFGDFLL